MCLPGTYHAVITRLPTIKAILLICLFSGVLKEGVVEVDHADTFNIFQNIISKTRMHGNVAARDNQLYQLTSHFSMHNNKKSSN